MEIQQRRLTELKRRGKMPHDKDIEERHFIPRNARPVNTTTSTTIQSLLHATYCHVFLLISLWSARRFFVFVLFLSFFLGSLF